MNTNQEIVEDTPQYRSAMIMAPLSAPPLPRSFASPAKLQTRSTPSKPAPMASSVWHVSNLPALPAHYILERSNVFVEGPSQSVADRICNSLRLDSISANVSPDDENLLLAETSDCLKFAVRLFTDNGMTVVEVQRLQGCSFEFRGTARSILRSATGINASEMPKRTFPLPRCIPEPSIEEKRKRVEDGAQIALDLVQSHRLDSQLLGLQSLEQLTKSCDAKTIASKKALSAGCIVKLVSIIETSELRLEGQFSQMRTKALGCLANALSTVAESGDVGSVAPSQIKSEAFLCSLVAAMDKSTEKPHEATQAARCMHSLIQCSEVKSLISSLDMDSTVQLACTVGSCRNALLEQEAKRLKMSLESCI